MHTGHARKKRTDCYWGLHFDFHATLNDRELGKHLTREMIEMIIDKARPDYIQVDCKGHPGIASYPTEVGVPAEEFLRDPLKLWREITAEQGIILLVHFSGVWDYEMVKRNPEWARKDAEGNPSKEATSTFGPYRDLVMIPQLKEISDCYQVDGAWIDGDCWGVEPDYSERAIAAFREAYAYSGPIPHAPGDPFYSEWADFNRESFRANVRKIADELHRHNPEFQIASNWAFSSFMPEAVSANVDFLSGDLTPEDSVNAARLEARILAGQKQVWDLMSWSFNKIPGQALYSTKSAVQLMQEAAAVISQGGGFQVYLKQRRDASVHMWPMDIMAEVGRFCKEREYWCRDAEPIPQVGLLLSRHALYETSGRLFGAWGRMLDGTRGALQALLEAGQTVDIVIEHMLEERLKEYSLIVVPEWKVLEEACKEQLLTYAREGGRLLVIGPDAISVFGPSLGIQVPVPASETIMWLEHGGRMAGLETNVAVNPHNTLSGMMAREDIGGLYKENDTLLEPAVPAASVIPYGEGGIGCVWFDYGRPYLTKKTTVQRDFLGALARRLMPKPLVEVAGSHSVEVAAARKEGRLIVHLINTSGPHSAPNVAVFDELQPIGPLQVTIRSEQRPSSVQLQPAGKEVSFQYDNGMLTISGIVVSIHDMLVMEYA